MATIPAPIVAVCSNRPRPSVQRGARGSQWWRRDVWHIAGANGRTLCGVDTADWLTIGETEINESCCAKCRAKVV